MCGIVGVISENIADENLASSMEEALLRLSKRGPDFQDSYNDDFALVGHTRLSIIDTTSDSNQPFWDSTNRYCLVFNGEIFNYKSIRSQLESTGIQFRTNSDTETLLYLLIGKGADALQQLNGFFAFCFYDKKEQKILIARDRFGIKPLVYSYENKRLVFASELKALMPFLTQKEIDKTSLQKFFQFNYIPDPYTILQGVYKLQPGELLSYESGKLTKQKYYSYYPSAKKFEGSYATAKKEVKQVLEQATVDRMIADVPLGTFLSGGIDSSIVSTIASRHTKHLNTFSIGFKDEPFFDETKFAQIVAKNINSNHTVFSLSNDDLFEHYTDALDYFDEPFADSSALNMFILSKRTKNNITVALSGDGADELFSGYNKHQALWMADQSNLKNKLVKNLGGVVGNILPKSRDSKIGNVGRKLSKFSSGLKLSSKERYLQWASFMKQADAELLTDAKFSHNGALSYLDTEIHTFNDYLYRDFNLVLPGDMLRKVDAMSMANSLEVRTPFLDYRLVELVFSMPPEFKIDATNRKRILKDAFIEDLPIEIFNRGKKGFEVPLKKWFDNELKEILKKEVFDQELIESQGILNWKLVSGIEKRLYSKNPDDAVHNTWALLSFQRWLNRYFYN